VRGYHLNGLYSPVGWQSWGDIAKEFVEKHRNPEEYKGFVNTVLAETWKERGEAPEWERLFHRREKGQASPWVPLPKRALFLTAGVDVQADRLVLEVVAWGRGKESWSVECGVLPGKTDDLGPNGPWGQLDALLDRGYPHAGGTVLKVAVLAVDSGYNTSTVYSWARKFPMNRVIAIKGQGGTIGAIVGSPSPVEINLRGQRPIHGYKVWPVTGGVVKQELYGFLTLQQPTEEGAALPPGWCHFPEQDEDYFKQLTAEHLVSRKNRRGYTTFEWELIPGRENHVLDARVYARAAAAVAGLDRFQESDWLKLERNVGAA
jgi:phage terminase large subunit GpA-like protein